jgi:hypothetical protein
MDPLDVFTGAAHQRVIKAPKVCSIFHVFCENLGNIAFTPDVGDCAVAVRHPFLNQVFFVCVVTIAFSCHVVAPLDASIITVVERGRNLCVGDGVSQGQQGRDLIPCIYHQTASNVCRSDF